MRLSTNTEHLKHFVILGIAMQAIFNDAGVHAPRVVTFQATLLTIAITSPPRVSSPTITEAAIARPRRCRRTS